MAKTGCTLKYLARGVIPSRDSKSALLAELQEVIPQSTVTVLPVNQGYSIELEFTDIAPFHRSPPERKHISGPEPLATNFAPVAAKALIT